MPPPLPSKSFLEDLEAIEILAWTPTRRAADLADNLAEIYRRAANARFGEYDVTAVARAAPELMYRLFDLRLALRQRIPEFEAKGLMTALVSQSLRDVFRVLRYVSDMLGEIAIGNARLHDDEPPARAFTGFNHNTLVDAKFYNGGDVQFESGDVLLVRGRQHNSAAIARIGDVDSQFSHLAIVYIDPDKKYWLVESLIEEGAVVTPLASALEHGVVRAVLYRHKDATLAARAADHIARYVTRSSTEAGRKIHYDFTMRLDDAPNLFCSKLVRLAYEKASQGSYKMPAYPTRLMMRNRDFLDRIGVATDVTFAPADIDLEASFDLVAEWQDYRETSNIRLQDFTMDKVFQWMDEHGLRFVETPTIRLVANLGKWSSTFSDTARQLLASALPRVPPNMRRKTIATVAMLHRTAEPIYYELQDLENRTIAATGVPMHGLEILDHLEAIRVRERNYIGYLQPIAEPSAPLKRKPSPAVA